VTIDELRLAGVKVENTGGRVMDKGETPNISYGRLSDSCETQR
jgi:hypothetical protein